MSSVVFYGQPGSGKSTLAASACKLGYRVHFIDIDGKLKTMENLKSWIAEQKVTYQELEAPLLDISLSARARQEKYYPKLKPKGYIELCGIIR